MEPACGSGLAEVTRPFPGTVGGNAVSAVGRMGYGNLRPKRAEITSVLLETKDLGAVWGALLARFGVGIGALGAHPRKRLRKSFGIKGLQGVLSQSGMAVKALKRIAFTGDKPTVMHTTSQSGMAVKALKLSLYSSGCMISSSRGRNQEWP